MKDETLQKLIKLLHEGFMREFFGKEKTLKQLRAEARLRGFNDISKLTKTQFTIEKFAFKTTRLGSIEKTKSIGESKETWNQKCYKAQKDTTHQRN